MLFANKPNFASVHSAGIAFEFGSKAWHNVPRISLAAAIRYLFWFGGKISIAKDHYHVPDFIYNRFGQLVAQIDYHLEL